MTARSWERISPFQVGWGWEKNKPETFEGNFETPGVHNTALSNAIGEAVDFQLSIGKEAIENRGRELAAFTKDLLTGLPGVRLLTPRDPALCGSMSAFTFPAAESDQRLMGALKTRGIVVPARADRTGGWLRASTHIFNSRGDVEILAEALKEGLAG